MNHTRSQLLFGVGPWDKGRRPTMLDSVGLILKGLCVQACSTTAMCWKKITTRMNNLCLNSLGSRCGWCAQGGMSKAARPFLTIRIRRYLPLVRSFILCTPGRMVTTVQMVRTQADGRKHTKFQPSSFAQWKFEAEKLAALNLFCCASCVELDLF